MATMVELLAQKKKRSPRGFAMIIILVVALAAALIAGTMLVSAGSTAATTAQAKGAEIARELAAAGMQRSNAYLNTLLPQSGDFDLALDPDQVADCAGLPSAPTCGGANFCNRPKFTDGSSVTYNGKAYTSVPLNGGAYLVRYDDNADDQHTEPLWDAQTSNHNAHSCDEGAAIAGADNPLRDRDRAVLVTVIGIWPGNDPSTASHRTTLRKLFTYRTDPTVPAFEAGHDIDAGGGGTKLEACSTVSGVQAVHDFKGGSASRACTCGDSHANNIGSWNKCTTMGGSLCGASTTCAAGSSLTPGPALASLHLWNNANFDWESPCNFWIDKLPAQSTFILWVWDPAANRGPGGVCTGYSGDFAGAGPPDITTTGSYANCWTPVVVDDALNDVATPGNCASVSAGLGPGADAVGTITSVPPTDRCEWRPRGNAGAVAMSAADVNTVMSGIPGAAAKAPPAAAATTFTKPDWATTCQISFPNQVRVGCGAACDGTNNAFEDSTGSFGEYYVSGGSAAGLNAVPAGAYYYPGDLTLGAGEAFGGAPAPTPPPAPLDLDGMPLATIVVQGSLTANGGYRGWFAPGHTLPGGNLPAIIALGDPSGGDVKLQTSPGVLRIAGSVYAAHDFIWQDTGAPAIRPFDGEVHVGNNVHFDSGNTFLWQYFNPLQPVQQSTLPSAPLTFISSE